MLETIDTAPRSTIGAEGEAAAGRFRMWEFPTLLPARKVGETAPERSPIFRDFTLARARAEPLASKQKKGVGAAAKRRPAGSRETG
jgi:hypothetical protein